MNELSGRTATDGRPAGGRGRPGDETGVDDAARLYLALGRTLRALRRHAPAPTVGHGGLSALAALTREGPMRVGQLAALEGVGAPSMTRVVGALEAMGHVRKRPDPDNGRACVVEATASGSGVVSAGREARMEAVRRRMSALEETDRAALVAAVPVLERLAAADGLTNRGAPRRT